MLMCIQNLFRFCELVLGILCRNQILTSIKDRNSVKILRKIMSTCNNPKQDLVNVDVHTKFGRILSIHSRDILRKMTGNNPKLDLANDDEHTKFGQILSIHSQDIERKRNSDVNKGP